MTIQKLLDSTLNLSTRVVYVVDPPIFCYDNNDNEKIIAPASHWASSAADRLKGAFLSTGAIVEDANVHDTLGLCLLVKAPVKDLFNNNNIDPYKYSLCASIEYYYKTRRDGTYICNNIKCEDVQNVGIANGCNAGTYSYYLDLPILNDYYQKQKLKELKNNVFWAYDKTRLTNFKNLKTITSTDITKLFPSTLTTPNTTFDKLNKLLKEKYGKTITGR